ncbi:synaptojanin-1-like isoform X2 [Nilaparvata lugens]|uniref:synaptojanin-1-like isoform X2 n=1 Tax=Nilaparvata lugens TaxID=108931 RepID=UPI00193DAABA|nr:synaptojanin-1-like isoform X2 [Nilaparvata lugens]
MALEKDLRVLEKNIPGQPYSILLEKQNVEPGLLLGSQAIILLERTEKDMKKKEMNELFDAYGILGILTANSGQYLIMVTGIAFVGDLADDFTSIYRITQTTFIPLRGPCADNEEISDLRKFLNSGMFYFSWMPGNNPPRDITMCAQRKAKVFQPDNRFMWNRTLHVAFIMAGIECDVWLLRVICGSVQIRTVFVGSREARAIIFSRICLERAGTRCSVRGLNDEGFAATFVETEHITVFKKSYTSYVQIRGSVPIFWEQPGIKAGSEKVRISREFIPTIIPYQKHVMDLKGKYGHLIFVNLLSKSPSKEGEALLSKAFEAHHCSLPECEDIPFVSFDYDEESRVEGALNKLKSKVDEHMQAHSFYFIHWDDEKRAYEAKSIQHGTIRTNDLDCLDRTNNVQSFFALEMLEKQLEVLGVLHLQNKDHMLSSFRQVFKQLWAANLNELSRFFTGSGNTMVMDVAHSAAESQLQDTLPDTNKQAAIDLLLGNADAAELADKARCLLAPSIFYAPYRVLREMITRSPMYTENRKLRISIGTYNVNGGKQFGGSEFKLVPLADWLLDCYKFKQRRCAGPIRNPNLRIGPTNFGTEIFAIGVQDIVDLNAADIDSASAENAKEWGRDLLRVICRDEEYTILTYVQLLGVCLYIFVKPRLIQYIRDVDVGSVKTGLEGATGGNKGAVAVRFTVYSSSVAFVCAHLVAAGPSQVAQTNAQLDKITSQMSFSGRSLNSHDYVFWCGDFNYRVDMSREDIMKCLNEGKRLAAFAQDQLVKEQQSGRIFPNFLEGHINFDPTSKYEPFSLEYDTSDMETSPAWTDRVLWRRKKQFYEHDAGWSQGRCLFYGRAELVQSDHRPVISIIEIDIQQIDKEKRSEVFDRVINDLGPPDATFTIQAVDAQEDCFTDDYISAVVRRFSHFGQVLFSRHVRFNTLVLTLRDGQQVKAACKRRLFKVRGVKLYTSYTSSPSKWNRFYLNQIEICSSKTGAMNSYLRPLWICDSIIQQDDATEDEAIASTSAATHEPAPVQVEPYLAPIELEDGQEEMPLEEAALIKAMQDLQSFSLIPAPPFIAVIPPPLPPLLRRLIRADHHPPSLPPHH